jgi:hypothetical protein
MLLAHSDNAEFNVRLANYIAFSQEAMEGFMKVCESFARVEAYGHKQAGTVLLAALRGMAMGMPFMEALEKICVIHGRPSIRGPAAKARIDTVHPGHAECIESTDKVCKWHFTRTYKNGTSIEKTFERNIEAFTHLLNSEKGGRSWRTYPARMLKWNVYGEGAQEIYGDVLGGLYMAEEMEGVGEDSAPRQSARKAPPPRNRVAEELGRRMTAVVRLELERTDNVPPLDSDDYRKAVEAGKKRLWAELCSSVLKRKVRNIGELDEAAATAAIQWLTKQEESLQTPA